MGWRGTNEGDNLKAISGWESNGNGMNSSGFTAVPGGYCFNGEGNRMGDLAVFWSSTDYDNKEAWDRVLNQAYSTVGRDNSHNKDDGLSIRLIRD